MKDTTDGSPTGSNNTSAASSGSSRPSRPGGETTIYTERQWVPFYWWCIAAGVVALLSIQMGFNRPIIWPIATAIVFGALAIWALFSLSRRTLAVTEDKDGERWLHAGPATLPASVISRTIAVPSTAKSAAMGRQLDPEAYVVSRAWIPEMAMLVLDDPEDPTPYWLVSSRDPDALLEALARPIY